MAILKTVGRKYFLILLELAFIMVVGILKHFLPDMPADAMLTASVTACGLYFGVNFVQKRQEIINAQEDNGNSE